MDNNFKKEVIKKLGENLMEYGFSVQKEEDEENELLTLRCGFVLSDEQPVPMVMEMTFYNLDTNPILQFYTYIASGLPAELIEKLRPVIDEFNCYAPLGHMGIYDEDSQLYYRYSLVFGEDEDIDRAVDRSEDILELMLLILKANYEKLETKEEE